MPTFVVFVKIFITLSFVLLTMFLHRWVDPEFEDEEDMSRDEEAGPAQRMS